MNLIIPALLLAALVVWRWQARSRHEESKQERFIREHCQPSVLPVPCAPDNEAGVNLSDADDCALTYSLPAYDPSTDPQWAAGRARLLGATRDHQKGDQT